MLQCRNFIYRLTLQGTNRRIRDPYVRWCERRTPSVYLAEPSTRLAVRAFFLRSATFLVLLNWWTFLAPITAINTAVSLLWFQYSFAVFALVKVLASICRHCFFFFVSAVGASDC